MIVKPSSSFIQPGTSRRAVAALLLSIALALTCVAPSHARTGRSGTSVDGVERPATGGIFHFLMRIFGLAGGTMDPNGQH